MTAPAAPLLSDRTALPVPADSARPSAARRAAVAVTGVLAAFFPTVFSVTISWQLATGVEADHRFHQVTGQGLLLCALWLAGLLPLVRAGWRGTAPSVGASAHAVVVAGSAVAVGLVAPGAGGLVLALAAAVTTGLLLAALPVRPTFRGALGALDPVLAPFALLTAALMAPFVLGEIGLQQTSSDEHAQMAHYFDMAWVSLVLVLLAALAAVVPSARGRAAWTAGGLVLVGASRMAFTPDVTWSALAVGLGTVASLALLAGRRRR